MIPKFRAWHRELGRMMLIKNMYFQDSRIEELELNDAVMNDYITASPDEIELMQSTGLKDKNGKEIFEGDIITNGMDIVDVRNHETLGFYTLVNGREVFFGHGTSIEEFEEDIEGFSEIAEIIGNIYENKELLDAGRRMDHGELPHDA